MLKYGFLGGITTNDFVSVRYPKIYTAYAASNVRESSICIQKRCFDLERRWLVHSVAVDHVSNVEASKANLEDALQFVSRLGCIWLRLCVREDSIAAAFADVKRLTVPRIN